MIWVFLAGLWIGAFFGVMGAGILHAAADHDQ